MTSWDNHHPPHDHPDFDAYLNTLTDDDLEAMNATTIKINKPLDTLDDHTEI